MVAKPLDHSLAWDGIILASIRRLLTGWLHETLILFEECCGIQNRLRLMEQLRVL